MMEANVVDVLLGCKIRQESQHAAEHGRASAAWANLVENATEASVSVVPAHRSSRGESADLGMPHDDTT